MYFSFVPGRVRIRLEDQAMMDRIVRMIQNMPGILETTTNPRTGSLLVRYDELLLDHATLETLMETYLPQVAKSMHSSPKKTTTMGVVKRGMLASLGVALISALLDKEEPHIAMGAFFLGLLSYHLYAYRKRLFA